jgi:hypothetical protein
VDQVPARQVSRRASTEDIPALGSRRIDCLVPCGRQFDALGSLAAGYGPPQSGRLSNSTAQPPWARTVGTIAGVGGRSTFAGSRTTAIVLPLMSKTSPSSLRASLPFATQRDLARRAAAAVRGRPPSRPLAREARAFGALRRAPTRAATLTMSTFRFPLSEKRATRTRASG